MTLNCVLITSCHVKTQMLFSVHVNLFKNVSRSGKWLYKNELQKRFYMFLYICDTVITVYILVMCNVSYHDIKKKIIIRPITNESLIRVQDF